MKYKALLDGLEASEVNVTNLEYSSRFDAEYYRPSLLYYENIINSHSNSKKLSYCSDFLIGPFGSAFTVDNYTDDKTYRYIRGKDVKPLQLMDNDNVYMPTQDYHRLIRYALKENDILVSVVGTVGNAALVTSKDLPAIFSCKSTVIRVNKDIKSTYLLAYLNCKFGQSLLLRKERGAIQKGLNLDDLKTLDIYIPTEKFQNEISRIFLISTDMLEMSKNIYNEAEELLLSELGLLDFVPNSDNIVVKSFSDSFSVSGRLDSEYYQPQYDDIEQMIYSKLHTFINKEFLQITTSFDKTKDGYNYIEIGDVNVSDGIHSYNYVVTEELPANAKIKVANGDLIVSTVRPYRGAVSIINTEDTDLVVSGAFTVLRSKFESNYSTQVLQVLLRTQIYKDLMLKYNVGSSYPVIKDENVMNLPIPLLSDKIQEQIDAKIKQSFALRKQSKQLLELAKRAVEVAIEDSEHSAMELINNARY